MNELAEKRLRLALKIMSGRIDIDLLSSNGWDILGFDSYRFSCYGKPNIDDIKLRAEEIIYEQIRSKE